MDGINQRVSADNCLCFVDLADDREVVLNILGLNTRKCLKTFVQSEKSNCADEDNKNQVLKNSKSWFKGISKRNNNDPSGKN